MSPSPKNGRADPGLSIIYRRLDAITHLPRNPKTHDIGAIVAAIEEFGVLDPIGLNDKTGHDLDGNGRLKALRAMMADNRLKIPRGVRLDRDGMWLVPTVAGIDLDAQTEERAGLALNRTHDLGDYDREQLTTVLSDLASKDRLAGTGYDRDDVDALLRALGRDGKGANYRADGSQTGDEPSVTNEGWVKLEFVMPEEMRDSVIEILRAYQTRHRIKTLYESLHAVLTKANNGKL